MKVRVWKIITIILLLISGFTIISAKNYADSLVLVSLASSVPNSIRTELAVTGGLYYKETVRVIIPEGCIVEGVFAESGDYVTAGDALIQLKEADLKILYYQNQLEKENLENIRKNGGTEGKQAYWQLQVLEEQITFLENLFEMEGLICTSADGYVIHQEYEEGDRTEDSILVELGSAESGCFLEWSLEPEDYRSYTGTAFIHGQEKKLDKSVPLFENGVYIYRTELPEITKCIHGERVQIQLRYVSEEHRAVIPKSCVWYDADGSTYVYEVLSRKRNFGEEFYVVKAGVTIVEQDESNVAVKSPLTDIVLRSSEPLADMTAVAVLKNEEG